MRNLIVTGLLVVMTLPVAAQDNTCFSSIGVNTTKSVIFNTLRGGAAAQIVKCAAAEKWRTEFYIANKTFLDAVSQGNSALYVSELGASIDKLETAIRELH